jgi:hypothetical protein
MASSVTDVMKELIPALGACGGNISFEMFKFH